LDHIVSEFILPALSTSMAAIDRLADAGRVRRLPTRVLLFLACPRCGRTVHLAGPF
jgi:hypothetical protein